MTSRYILKHNLAVSRVAKAILWPFCRKTEAYIFVATTGRSGTQTLQRVFSQLDGCVSLHEAYPIMNGHVMRELNNNRPAAAKDAYNFSKAINIRWISMGYRYYAETNHMFIKSFCDFGVQDLGEKLKVVHLVRHPIGVAASISALNHHPGTQEGNEWYLDYNAAANIIQIADVLDGVPYFSSPFFKALWYWYETEARVEAFRMKYGHVPIFPLLTEDLSDRSALCALFNDMGLDYDKQKFLVMKEVRENRKLAQKSEAPPPLIDAKRMHDDFKQMLFERGYSLPSSLSYFGESAG